MRSEAEKGRRRLRIFAIGIAVLFGGLAFANWWTNRDELRAGSKLVSGGGAPLEIDDVPTTYHAELRVENRAGKDPIVITERVWIRRPFASRIESWREGKRLSVRHSAFGVLTSRSANAEPLNLAAPPSVASGDLRIDAVLEDATKDRTVLRREKREVYGRVCQVFRAGGPVSAGDLKRYQPGTGEYADVCVDRHGLVLEEYWVSKGELLQRRAVTDLEVDISIDDELFEIDVPPKKGFDRGAVERLPKEGSEGLWTFKDRPKGFDYLGRYAVAISQNAFPRQDQLAPSMAPVSTTDVYVRGPDLLLVDQDPSLAVATQQEGRQAREIDLEGFKDTVVIFDARMTEIHGQDAEGPSIIRVLGTLAPSELERFARSLEQVED